MCERVVLKGQEAKALWKQGKEVWNQWVADNSDADVDFSHVEFEEADAQEWVGLNHTHRFGYNFEGFEFPSGRLSFDSASFSRGDVSFESAKFRSEVVSFERAKFSSENTIFSFACFQSQELTFDCCDFGGGVLDFSGANVDTIITSFFGVNFGEGYKNFGGVKFQGRGVRFNECEFGGGRVDFADSTFDVEIISFGSSKFGDGHVNFHCASFDGKETTFFKCDFGNGDVDFTHTKFNCDSVSIAFSKFGNGFVTFKGADFGRGSTKFDATEFGDGDVYFIDTLFGDISNTFCWVKFGTGVVNFSSANFKGRVVDFQQANFGAGNLFFNGTNFEGKAVHFDNISVSGFADFDDVVLGEICTCFSFRKATFSGPFSLSFGPYSLRNLRREEITFIPDLIGCQASHHVALHRLYCRPQGIRSIEQSEIIDSEDAARLCRLKELAENNKDHEAALRFHADEMRVKRATTSSKAAATLDWMFDCFSLYGQSIWRPFAGLAATVLFLTIVAIAGSPYELSWLTLVEGFTFSLGKAIPFVGSIAGDSGVAAKALGLPSWYAPISFVFSLFSFVFLFLIGLGLRNRFRI